MRDAQKDLELCERATPGPWVVDTADDEYCSSISGVISAAEQDRIAEISRQRLHRGDFPEETLWIAVSPGCAPVRLTDGHTPYEDFDFIAAAREALPYWIHRCLELEKAARDACASFECYAALNRPESEWDEYDHMMLPRWKRLVDLLGGPDEIALQKKGGVG